MTHPKEAVEAVERALRDAHGSPPWATWGVEATALLDQIAPMFAARAEADAREAALQYLSDTGQLMDRIAAMEADKAAVVEACAAVADKAALARQAQMDGPNRKGDRMQQERWRVGKQQAEIIAAAIRAFTPQPFATTAPGATLQPQDMRMI